MKSELHDTKIDLQLQEFNVNMLQTGSKETIDTPKEKKLLAELQVYIDVETTRLDKLRHYARRGKSHQDNQRFPSSHSTHLNK